MEKQYSYPTLIEPDPNGDHRVVGQDGSCATPLFYGTYEECKQWQKENCA